MDTRVGGWRGLKGKRGNKTGKVGKMSVNYCDTEITMEVKLLNRGGTYSKRLEMEWMKN